MTAGALAYARVSTEEQAEHGGSLAMQEDRIRGYCRAAGLELSDVVTEEGVSAGKPLHERPGGARLLTAIASKRAGHVVALKLDRLFRSTVDALNQIEEWDEHHIALHLVDMGGSAVNTASAIGRLFLTLLSGFAEFERVLIAERTAAVLHHKRSVLEVYGPTPLGYERIGDRLVADPAEQQVITRILGMRAEGWSFSRIARRFNAEQVPTKQGGQWHHSTVSYLARNVLYQEVE